MRHQTVSMVLVVCGICLSMTAPAVAQVNSQAAANSAVQAAGPNKPPTVTGSGTPSTVPVWTGASGLGDSHIHDNGATVDVSVPVSGTNSAMGLAGVSGFGVEYGVSGVASGAVSYGVAGFSAQGVGVHAMSTTGVGIRAGTGDCDAVGCISTAGIGGQFITAVGGILLEGFVSTTPSRGVPSVWDQRFRVDADGNLWTWGNAYKPGGGSWSTLSDVRTKKSVEPLSNALGQLLKLHGVTYEYTNPSAFHELPGTHVGMVAQDVEQVFPSWVDTGADGYKRVTFRGFESVAVEAVRELDATSKEAMARIADLEHQNAELRHAIEALSETVRSLQQR
jgi:endosialidase-like protein